MEFHSVTELAERMLSHLKPLEMALVIECGREDSGVASGMFCHIHLLLGTSSQPPKPRSLDPTPAMSTEWTLPVRVQMALRLPDPILGFDIFAFLMHGIRTR